VELAPGLPLELVPVAWLVGTWQGVGVAGYPTSPQVRFGQEAVFGHAFGAGAAVSAGVRHYPGDPPYLTYRSRSWLLDDAGDQVRPLAEETGYWRILPRPDPTEPVDGVGDPLGAASRTPLEVVLVHPIGLVELWDGEVDGARVELGTDVVAHSPVARSYTAGHRIYGLVEGDLLWAMDMAAVDQPLQPHLSARLRRAG
jgi:THAP4-like, heme-binding beta-barrel domain